MKNDIFTAIGAAIIGFVLAFFITRLFIGEIADFTYKTVDASVGAELEEPNPEVFNYRAINPTVEVSIGQCTSYGPEGECIDELLDEAVNNEENNNPEANQENN